MNAKNLITLTLVAAVSWVGAGLARAAMISINPSKDNTLYEYDPAEGDHSNGAGFHFFAGENGMGELRRGVLAFDIAGTIPAGSTITAVSLTMNMSMTPAGPETVQLHRLLADWGEGTTHAPMGEGDGAPATSNDATWRHRFFDSVFWTTQGGGFSATVSASQSVSGTEQYTWSSTQMIADVQLWLDNPASNFGWLVLGDESTTATAKRFDTRESGSPPVLTIVYTAPTPRLGNISTRAFVQTSDNVMIGGFIVQGTEPKRVIIRVVGPELSQYGVPDPLQDPTLELHDGNGALIASNDDWQHMIIGGIITHDQVQEIQNSGYAPGDLRESAIIAELPAGNYTAIVRGVNSTIGVALVEVYDLSPQTNSIREINSILGNISTRSFVQTGDNVMIGGFIVQGTQPKRVIIRAIGPELSQYGVPDPLQDPTLELHDGNGTLIGSNDDWQHTIIGGTITHDQVQEIQQSGYAPGDPRESAIIADLPAGNYTAIVRGVNSTTGVALVEVYDLH